MKVLSSVKKIILIIVYRVLFFVTRFLPSQDKVVASTMRGRKFSDNPRFIIEELHRIRPDLKIVWFADDRWPQNIPSWVKVVPYHRFKKLKRFYEMATAKVWVYSHLFEYFVVKRNDQLFVQTFHASIPIKKVYLDMNHDLESYKRTKQYKELINTSDISDVFISNSTYYEKVYRHAFAYNGPILMSGFPRNDELINSVSDFRTAVKEELQQAGKNIFLYVPTFRDEFERTHHIDFSVYNIDFEGVYHALIEVFGGEWVILVKFHPIMQIYIKDYKGFSLPFVKDVTSYVNIQALLSASDFVLTDYSSTICDALIAGVPGLTIALDYDEYQKERSVYFELEELPFPFAKSNSELIANIKTFNRKEYEKQCEIFKNRIGLFETGRASKVIAQKILDFIDGKYVDWESDV